MPFPLLVKPTSAAQYLKNDSSIHSNVKKKSRTLLREKRNILITLLDVKALEVGNRGFQRCDNVNNNINFHLLLFLLHEFPACAFLTVVCLNVTAKRLFWFEPSGQSNC